MAAKGKDPGQPTPFFRRREVKGAIDRLSRVNNLTIFVGAGVGTELGLPGWAQLVRRLLADAIAGPRREIWKRHLREDEAAVVDRLLTEESLLGAATIAKARLGKRFHRSLHHALYGKEWKDGTLLIPSSVTGPARLASTTVEAIAAVYAAFAESGAQWSCDIVTTNYDPSLEEALMSMGIEASPWFDDANPPEDRGIDHPVRHLHGYLADDKTTDGEVVLTEADYHQEGAKKLSWQESYLRRRLGESTLLFVGTSLSDPDILSILFRSAEGRNPAVALLVDPSPADGVPDILPEPDACAQAASELRGERWRSAGVDVLKAAYISQPRQFLWEVAMHKRDPDAVSYGKRLVRWYQEQGEGMRLGIASASLFDLVQDGLSEFLAEVLEQVRNLVREGGHALPDEEALAIHVWLRSTLPLQLGPQEDPDLCAMAMIHCSDRAWRSPEAVDTRRIMLPTRRAALMSFCERRVVEHSFDGSDQWNYVLAAPVVLADDHSRLPVGAVTLVSTAPAHESVLTKLDLNIRQEIVEFLDEVVTGVLSD
jgi:hypothetical protein